MTRQDVINAYRILFNREPESEAIINDKIQGHHDIWSLVDAILVSPEFRSKATAREAVRATDPNCRVQMAGTEENLARLRDHVRQTWTKFGETEPHYSVLTGPEYLPHQMTQERQDFFYSTGREWAEEFSTVLRRNGIAAPNGRLVDFGCGLGRVGEHLSSMFERYLGVDISPTHLAVARLRFEALGRANAEFQLLSDFMKGEERFNAIYCVLVLQHNPPPIMLEMFNHLLLRLAPGGVCFIQISTTIFNYAFNLADYLRSIEGSAVMEMHALPQRFIFDAIRTNACRCIEVYRDDCTGSMGDSYRFLIQRP